jgi:hypothetical protein
MGNEMEGITNDKTDLLVFFQVELFTAIVTIISGKIIAAVLAA